MARAIRRTQVNECRQCSTFCDRVIRPATCVAAGCPSLYQYDDPLTGRRYMGCVHKVFATEIDVALFDAAERTRAPGLVLAMQADMWDTTAPPANLTAFEPIKAVIAERAEQFAKPVLLLQGDSHLLKVDRPAGQPDNVARIVVQGSTNQPRLWTKLTVDPSRAGVFSCEQVEYRTRTATPCAAPLAP